MKKPLFAHSDGALWIDAFLFASCLSIVARKDLNSAVISPI